MNDLTGFINLMQSLELLDHIKFSVEIKPEKNLKNKNGLTKDDEVMLAENGSAIQNIEPTHEIETLMNHSIESRMDNIIDVIIDNTLNHSWNKQSVYDYMQNIAIELEDEINKKVNDNFKDLFKIKLIKI